MGTIKVGDVVKTEEVAVSHDDAKLVAEIEAATSLYQSWSSTTALTLPTPAAPPAEEYAPVEKFVAGVVEYLCDPFCSLDPSERTQRVQQLHGIKKVCRSREDPLTLFKILLALRTAKHGQVLRLLSLDTHKSNEILRPVFELDPFIPPEALYATIVKEAQENRIGASSQHETSAIDQEKILENDERLQAFFSYRIADAHLHLLVALVSANSSYVAPVVSALWRMGTHGLSDCPTERITRVHAALSMVARICPKAKTEIFPAMANNFPFKLLPVSQQLWYAHQCLAVLKYMPHLHKEVMELLIDRCLEIDVEIKIEDGGNVKIEESKEEEEEADATIDNSDIFGLEIEEGKEKKKEEMTNPEEEVGEKTVDDMANKLDMLMLVMFQHVAIPSKAEGGGQVPHDFFDMLIPVFDSTIITTHRSKYVQFVLFLLCGLDYENNKGKPTAHDDSRLYRGFAAKLLENLFDPLRATTMRQSCGCYLASFLSRSAYICIDTVCETLCALLCWAEAYMVTFPTEASTTVVFRGKDIRNQCEAHALFYTVCQACFYIVCFRGGEAVRYYQTALANHLTNDDATDIEGINISPERWSRLCGHHLNPLKYCLESVRGEFLHVADILSLLEPTLLQSLSEEDIKLSTRSKRPKKRRSIMTPALLSKKKGKEGVGGLGRGSNPLNSFFPFDPYLLRRSYAFIEAYYRDWAGSIEKIPDENKVTLFNGAHRDSIDDTAGGYESEDSSGSSNSNASEDSEPGEKHMEMNPRDRERAMSLASAASDLAISLDKREGNPGSVFRPSANATVMPPKPTDTYASVTIDAKDIAAKKVQQKEAWSKATARKRSQSVGDNSW